MPFQDIEDTTTPELPRAPTLIERWARKIFLEDWGLKLLALTITLVLWLAVTGQNKPVTQRVSGVQLNFLRPDGLEISNDLPESLEVILTGSPVRLNEIAPRSLVATVDVSDQKAGERVVRLSLDRVRLDLPPGVKVEGFRPATIPLRLEPNVQAEVEVEVKLEGKLPDGYEVGGVSVNPARIRLRGPSDRISALHQAMTETIWLDGRKESFSLPRVSINIPDPKIDILDPTVDVRVEIVEKKRDEVQLRVASADDLPLLARVTGPTYRR